MDKLSGKSEEEAVMGDIPCNPLVFNKVTSVLCNICL